MKTLRIAFALLLVAGFCQTGQAQDFKSAAGVRFGSPWALSYKTFISESSAVEVYAGARFFSLWNWITINGAYQVHSPIAEVDGLQWYWGVGGGVQFWSYDFETDFGTTSFSVSGYLGAQYTFEDAPVSLTVDWVPTFFLGDRGSLSGWNTFGAGYYNLSARYIIGR
ncbi:MAG: hypothetical protein AAF828_13215 [Bacteroidota bacterium]